MAKPLRRLELRLPVNHPVWSLPEGSRSGIVREWLEVGRRLTGIEDYLRVIAEKFDCAQDMSKINSVTVPKTKRVDYQESEGFDKNAFLSHFK